MLTGANDWVEIFTNQDYVHTIAQRDNFTTLFVGVDKGATAPGLYRLGKINGQWKVARVQSMSAEAPYSMIWRQAPQLLSIYRD